MHESQVRYSSLVLAKMRSENILKDGIIFNNDYEGDPVAGAVKVPVRDGEVKVGDYDTVKGGDLSQGVTTYETLTINKDKFVNELIDGYDAASVPDNLVADRLDSAGYSCACTIDSDGATCLLAEGTKVGVGTVSPATAYSTVVDLRKQLSKANVPNDGRRYLLATPDAEMIAQCFGLSAAVVSVRSTTDEYMVAIRTVTVRISRRWDSTSCGWGLLMCFMTRKRGGSLRRIRELCRKHQMGRTPLSSTPLLRNVPATGQRVRTVTLLGVIRTEPMAVLAERDLTNRVEVV